MTRYKYSNEELANAVAQSISVAGVMRLLGIRPAGGSHFHVSRRIRSAGIDTQHFLGKASGRGTKQERLPPERILVRKDSHRPRTKVYLLRRALLEMGVVERCSECDIGSVWMDKPLSLHVDHIDGDGWNNEFGNLRFLCPNCHSQTSTFCRKISSRST